MKIGVLKRENWRNTGVETFERNTVPYLLEHDQFEPINFKIRTTYPFSVTIERLQLGRRIEKLSKDYDRIFIPSQDLVTCRPEKTDCEIIPYVHDVLPVTTNFSGWVATPLAKYYSRNIEKLETVIAASRNTATELQYRTRFNGTAEHIYQGVDTPNEQGDTERDIDLLYVGSVIDRKNPEFLREAIRIAENHGYNCVAVNYEPVDLPCETRVNVSESELNQLYERSRFYLHPSKAEGFGRTPLEAQSHGCLPLGLPTPINREVLSTDQGKAWSVMNQPRDVLYYLEMSEKRLEDGRNDARRNAGRYTWEKTREQLLNVLLE